MQCPCGGATKPYWELKDGTLATKCDGCGRRHHIKPRNRGDTNEEEAHSSNTDQAISKRQDVYFADFPSLQ
tara:strand:+ start:202 stop:414 length:213 start_codon:yes stop_codon:yes gene_type:complete